MESIASIIFNAVLVFLSLGASITLIKVKSRTDFKCLIFSINIVHISACVYTAIRVAQASSINRLALIPGWNSLPELTAYTVLLGIFIVSYLVTLVATVYKAINLPIESNNQHKD